MLSVKEAIPIKSDSSKLFWWSEYVILSKKVYLNWNYTPEVLDWHLEPSPQICFIWPKLFELEISWLWRWLWWWSASPGHILKTTRRGNTLVFVVSALGRQTQADPWGSLACQAHLLGEVHGNDAGHGAHGCNPSMVVAETSRSLGFLASQPCLLGEFQASEKQHHKIQCELLLRYDMCSHPLASTGSHPHL